MILEIDFNSDEALYIQLRNQIVIGIATSQLSAGDSLPSVRQLADRVGINMHTVNKGIYGLETGRLCEAGPKERCCYSHRLQ